jgi:ubiquinone biosynthesis protein
VTGSSSTEVVDQSVGAFSEQPPWLVDTDQLVWRRGLTAVRSVARRQVPVLIAPRRWPGLRAVRVVSVLGRAGLTWWARERPRGAQVDDDRARSASRAAISRRMRVAAERLGPTYIKLGQIISSGQGIFPTELVDEFKRCRDQVPPEPFETVRRVIEDDLGMRMPEVFAEFDPVPLAAASIAQVHRATLRPEFVAPFLGGAAAPRDPVEVVVKVQRPQVSDLVHRDLRVLAWLAPFLVGRIQVAALANPPALVEVFAETIAEEIDFRLEAENMLDVARTLADLGQRGYLVPRPHPSLVTRRVLVMERLSGFAFDDVTSIRSAGVDTHAIIRAGMIGFMEGALLHGIFHGDLHGGNLFVLPDGRTALLDFGIIGRLSTPRRLAFVRLLIAATMNDPKGQLAALRDLGALPRDVDLDAVFHELGLDQPPVDPTQLTSEQLIAELQRVTKALVGYGAKIPKELLLFVKNMVFLDGAIAALAPDLDLLGEVQTIALYFAQHHGMRLAAEAGIDPATWQLDMAGVKGSFGVDPTVERLTYRELTARRAIIRDRMERHRRRRRR